MSSSEVVWSSLGKLEVLACSQVAELLEGCFCICVRDWNLNSTEAPWKFVYPFPGPGLTLLAEGYTRARN